MWLGLPPEQVEDRFDNVRLIVEGTRRWVCNAAWLLGPQRISPSSLCGHAVLESDGLLEPGRYDRSGCGRHPCGCRRCLGRPRPEGGSPPRSSAPPGSTPAPAEADYGPVCPLAGGQVNPPGHGVFCGLSYTHRQVPLIRRPPCTPQWSHRHHRHPGLRQWGRVSSWHFGHRGGRPAPCGRNISTPFGS
jgi:hypothetical protein